MKRIKIIGILVVIFLSFSSIAQPWSVNPADYEFTMNVTGQIKISGTITNQDSAYIGAFVNNECRGYATATESNGNYKNYLLTIYSNTSSDEDITFKWIDEQDQEFAIANTMKYYTDSVICSADYPFIFMDQEDYASTDFLTFSVDSQVTSASINSSARTINVIVSENTDLTTVIPTFTIAPAAAAFIDDILQESEITQNDFSTQIVYNVKAIDGNDANWTVTIEHDDNAVEELNNDNNFSIYPNPATNYVQLVISNVQYNKNTSVFIYDVFGKIVKQFKIKNSELRINIEDLQNGIYIIKVGNATRKFIKQ